MSWTSPEVLPAVTALIGVLLTGIVGLLAETLRGRREARRRRADLAERVFEHKREAYLEFYRWALRFRHLVEDFNDSSLALLKIRRQGGHPRSEEDQAEERDLKIELEQLAKAKLDGFNIDNFRARDAEVRFYGTREVSEAAQAFTAATIRWSAMMQKAQIDKVLDLFTSDREVVPESEIAAIVDELTSAEAAFLRAVKRDLQVPM